MDNQHAVLAERIDALIKTVADQQDSINNLSSELNLLKAQVKQK
ncbi:hypothetical protein [Bacillus cereus]|nr:hypothetical protein [Bacillus cereus]